MKTVKVNEKVETVRFSCQEVCSVCSLFSNKKRKISKSLELLYPWAIINGRAVKIPNASYRILCALIFSNGKALTREYLLEYAWGDSEKAVPNNVNVAISELRLILKRTNIEIITERKIGYFLVFRKEL